MDTDGLPDGWEVTYFGNITSQTATSNADPDSLNNLQEYQWGYDPTLLDSNGNNVPDGYEDNVTAEGSGGDGLADLMEAVFGTNPLTYDIGWKTDTDGDGIPNSLDPTPSTPDNAPGLPSFNKCPL